MERLRFVAFAAAYKRVGAVFLEGNELRNWKMSTKAAVDCKYTKQFAQKMIDQWKPDVIITEDLAGATAKGLQTKQVISVIASIAEENPILDVSIKRQRRFVNKYEEAADLVTRYPQLADIQPIRRIFDCEPRSTVIFEAMILAESVKRDPTGQLAAAMG